MHGELGIGKTALIRAVAERADRRALIGGGLASLMWSSYLPILRALRVPIPAGDRTLVSSYIVHRVRDGVLVLDDLQYADRDTLAVLPAVAERVALLLAFRDGEPGSAGAWAVAEACGCELLELGGLDVEAAARLVRQRSSMLGELDVRAIVAASAGNPLLLEERARGEPGQRTIRELVESRLSRLSARARRAVALLALVGRPAPRELIADAVEELLEAGILEEHHAGVALRHAALGELAIEQLDDRSRRRLHRTLAASTADPGERARHLARGGRLAEASAAALEAAGQATLLGERARHLGLAAESASGAEADGLRLRAAAALAEAGEHTVAVRVLARVQAADGTTAAGATLARARTAIAAGDPRTARTATVQGLSLAGADRALVLQLRIERVRAELAVGTPAAQLLEQAVEVHELCGYAGVAEARAAAALGAVQLRAGDGLWRETLGSAIELARRSDEFDVECDAARTLLLGQWVHGETGAARELAEAMEQRCAGRLLRAPRVEFATRRLWFDLHERGLLADVIEECRELLLGVAPASVAGQIGSLLALALADTGELRESRLALESVAHGRHADRGRLLSWTRAEVELLSGEATRAAELAADCLADADAAHPVGALAALTGGWARFDLETLDEGPPEPSRSYGGATAELRGIARLPTDPASAREQFTAAASAWQAVQLRAALRCEWGAGESARRTGDRDAAIAQLRRAGREMRDSGVTSCSWRVSRSLREAGVREGTTRSADALGLTAREREILALVGQGLTTAAIARQLGLKSATVETHIESARDKLGAATRIEAAIRARESPTAASR